MDLTAPLPINKITKHLPAFSVYQVFLYSLSAIIVFILEPKIFHYMVNSGLSILQEENGIVKFLMLCLFYLGIAFFTLGSSILSLLIIRKKSFFNKQSSWLFYGFSGLYSGLIGFLSMSDTLDKATFDNIFDIIYLIYFLLLILQGFTIIALLFADKQPWIPTEKFTQGDSYSPLFLILSIIIVFLWLFCGIKILGIAWYLVIAYLFIVIHLLEYINKLTKKL